MTPPPEPSDSAADRAADRAPTTAATLQAALGASSLPLALIDHVGRVEWCSAGFAAALGMAAGADASVSGTEVRSWFDDGIAVLLALAPPATAEVGAAASPGAAADARVPSRWIASTHDAGGAARLLRLEPVGEAGLLRAEVARLQERLDLVQDFCQAGIFERDPRTLEGRWDAQMYRVFGLPVAPAGAPAPPYQEVAAMMFQEDRTRGGFRATLGRPGVHADRVRLRRPDGSVRHIHSQWKVFQDATGQAVRVLGVNTDDTEVFELARRAQVLREELDVVLRLGHIGLWRHDLASGRVHFDERACEQLGLRFDPDGLSLAEARALLHPDDLDAVNTSAAETLRAGEPTDMSLRYRRPGGGWLHMLSRRTLERDVAGRPLAFVGVLLDETERVERSRQALELAQWLETAAEAARIGLWSARPGDPRPDWNRRMFELFGLDPSQPSLPLGEWIRRCVHPEDRDRVAAQVTAWVHAGVGPIEVACRVLRPSDGALRWLELRGNADPGRPAAERRFEGVAIDVTEQQQTLQRLRDSSQRIALTASAVGLGSWELDIASDVSVWDEGMFKLRGVRSAPRTVSREEIASYLHPDDRTGVMDDQNRRRLGTEPWRMSFRVVWPDGTVRWLASRSAPITDDGGQPVRRIGLNWDVTESVLAEQAMRERELALAESRTKSRFMSHVSHELRTPLNAVLGFTQLLRDERAATSPAVREEWLAQIETAGHHLLALIDDVLTLSGVEAGEMRLRQRPVALAELVRSTLPLLERDARARGLELVAEEPLAGVAAADPVRLRQVLLNLLSNAVKYNRPGGAVRVAASEHGSDVVLTVTDTGRGIEPHALARIFEPFNRLGAEASDIPGTGIGLAISKALVEQMGGRIEVRSRPGAGTVFTVTLPRSEQAARAEDKAVAAVGEAGRERGVGRGVGDRRAPGARAAAAGAPAIAPVPSGPRARVLYVEDNAVNALLMRELLASQPWVELEIVVDARSGLRRAREWQPELILLDMQLPDLHGLAVLEALRADPATAAVRCVALSANAMPADVEAARAAGAVDYWTKPIQFAPFLASLARLLGQAGRGG